MTNKKSTWILNSSKTLILFIFLFIFASLNISAQTITNGNPSTILYDFRCDINDGANGCGGTCTKPASIPTDDCTLNVVLKGANWDDEGGTSTDTGFNWVHTGCSCHCPNDKSGSNCAGENQDINQNVQLPSKLGNPIGVSINGKNSCKGPLGIMIAHYVLTKAQCNPGFKCDSSTGTVQCIPACSPTQTTCGSTCVDLKTDNNNCGACGNKCDNNQKCTNGQCICSPESINPTPSTGDITFSQCSNHEYLFDGKNWNECDAIFKQYEIGDDKRNYLCISSGHQSIYECYGDGSPKSKGPDGKRLKTGEKVTGPDGNTYYCTQNKKFVTDLDASGLQSTCEKAGFKWTGTKCCSEADDNTCQSSFSFAGCPAEFNGCMLQDIQGCNKISEYYNDPGTIGACWNSTFVRLNDFGSNYSVIDYKGEFHGCAILKEDLANLKHKHTSRNLIINHTYCLNTPVENYYCSYAGTWNLTNGADKTHLSFAPAQTELKADCCGANQCWNGSICIDSQKAKPMEVFNGFRCIDGNWMQAIMKFNPSGKSGYCPKETQCLLNPEATNEIDQCVEDANYTSDDYCERGNWSSRTKLLALKLLKIKSSSGSPDFTIFCDTKENTLNYLQYSVGTSSASNILENDLQANNFCALTTAGKIIVAASINQNLESALSKNIFGIKSCINSDAFKDDGQYHYCNSDNKLWFNKKLNSIIYGKNGVNVPQEQEQQSFIRNLIGSIIDIIKHIINIQTDNLIDESLVKGIKKFDRLYLTQQGSKAITATIEGKGANNKNAVFEYRGLDFNMCIFIERFSESKRNGNEDDASLISCRKEGSNYYVLAQGSQFTKIDPDAAWPDLTSKLRLK